MFGLSERLSERLIQKVKSPIALKAVETKIDYFSNQFLHFIYAAVYHVYVYMGSVGTC